MARVIHLNDEKFDLHEGLTPAQADTVWGWFQHVDRKYAAAVEQNAALVENLGEEQRLGNLRIAEAEQAAGEAQRHFERAAAYHQERYEGWKRRAQQFVDQLRFRNDNQCATIEQQFERIAALENELRKAGEATKQCLAWGKDATKYRQQAREAVIALESAQRHMVALEDELKLTREQAHLYYHSASDASDEIQRLRDELANAQTMLKVERAGGDTQSAIIGDYSEKYDRLERGMAGIAEAFCRFLGEERFAIEQQAQQDANWPQNPSLAEVVAKIQENAGPAPGECMVSCPKGGECNHFGCVGAVCKRPDEVCPYCRSSSIFNGRCQNCHAALDGCSRPPVAVCEVIGVDAETADKINQLYAPGQPIFDANGFPLQMAPPAPGSQEMINYEVRAHRIAHALGIARTPTPEGWEDFVQPAPEPGAPGWHPPVNRHGMIVSTEVGFDPPAQVLIGAGPRAFSQLLAAVLEGFAEADQAPDDATVRESQFRFGRKVEGEIPVIIDLEGETLKACAERTRLKSQATAMRSLLEGKSAGVPELGAVYRRTCVHSERGVEGHSAYRITKLRSAARNSRHLMIEVGYRDFDDWEDEDDGVYLTRYFRQLLDTFRDSLEEREFMGALFESDPERVVFYGDQP